MKAPHESTKPTQSRSKASSGIDYSAQRFALQFYKVIAVAFNSLCYDVTGEIALCTNKRHEEKIGQGESYAKRIRKKSKNTKGEKRKRA